MIDKAITGNGDLYIDGTGAGSHTDNRVNIMSDGLKIFSGSVYVLANGKLGVWGGNGSGAIPDAGVVDVAGLFTLYGRSETIGGLTGNGIVQGHNAVLTVDNATDETFSGTLRNNPSETGPFALTKTGTGTLVLIGSSSYTDITTVNGGTLKVDGSLGNTEVSVSSAALAGNGSIGGAVYIDNGGNLATRISDWSGTAGSGFDDLSVQSLQILAGTPHVVTVDVASLTNFSEVAKTFQFLHASGGITGFSAVDFTVVVPGFTGTGTWAVQQNGNNLELVYSPASASAYDSWATAKGLTVANNGKTLDPDNDGLTNLQEFAFDGDPLSGASDGKRFAGIADPDGAGPESNALFFTVPVRFGAVFQGPGDLVSDPVSGIIYQIQGSNDLVDFTSTDVFEVSPALADGLPALSPGWTYRTFRRPSPVGASNPSGFIRSAVVESP
jgi:autotransporter-associated beta strand protein